MRAYRLAAPIKSTLPTLGSPGICICLLLSLAFSAQTAHTHTFLAGVVCPCGSVCFSHPHFSTSLHLILQTSTTPPPSNQHPAQTTPRLPGQDIPNSEHLSNTTTRPPLQKLVHSHSDRPDAPVLHTAGKKPSR